MSHVYFKITSPVTVKSKTGRVARNQPVTPGIRRLMPGVTPNLTGHNARNAPGIIGVYAINPGIHGSMLPFACVVVYSMYAS